MTLLDKVYVYYVNKFPEFRGYQEKAPINRNNPVLRNSSVWGLQVQSERRSSEFSKSMGVFASVL